MKKILSIILSILCVSSFSFCAFASNTKLESGNISICAGETFDVTYSLNGNSGVMGFSFELSYDDSAFEAVEVTKSANINSGIFNDSIGTSKDGIIKIVWTGTMNYYDNGELFTVKFKAKDTAAGSYKFNITCLEDDTFNEKWTDVVIESESITVKVENNSQISFWDKIVNFFKMIIDFIVSIFK